MKKNGRYWAAACTAGLILFSVPLAGAFQVPDTGITKCYDASGHEINPCPGPGQLYYGQDGNLISNGMSFADNGDGTLTDNVTGLVWQQGDSQSSLDWGAAVSFCNNLNTTGFGGHNSGWRLPDLVELHSIMDLSVTSGAAIDPSFSGTDAVAYWTSTEDADSSATKAWILDFGSTEDNTVLKTDLKNVRCVWEVTP